MTQRPFAKRNVGVQSLVWLLLVAMLLMGLTVTRQQALGSLHRHADAALQGSAPLATAASALASDWLNRWRQQQMFGHSALRLRMAADATLWPPSAGVQGHDDGHDHDSLERHHHAVGDASVVAVDGAAEAVAESADGGGAGAVVMLPVAATPSAGLAVPALATRTGPWPVASATAFVSRNIAPPLRPPAV